MKPVVSVLLPTHDRPAWLAQALISVLDGRFSDLEVIVSNNGAPEDTRRLQSVIPDPRVRWIEQDRDLGMLDNLLAAMALARGRYVAILHDDDRWSPHLLAALVPPLERHPEAVLAFGDQYVMLEQGEVDIAGTDANTLHSGRGELEEGLHHPFFGMVVRHTLPLLTCVFRRDALTESSVTPDVGTRLDIWLPYLLASSDRPAYFTPERLMYYRVHGTSDTSGGDLGNYLAGIHVRSRMLEDPRLVSSKDVLTKQLARDHVLAGARLLRRGARRPARSHLATAIRLDPGVKALGGWAAAWVAPRSLLGRL